MKDKKELKIDFRDGNRFYLYLGFIAFFALIMWLSSLGK
jgi:hypothetical protein